ncbi:redoxin domain-containing protein [Bacteroides sp. 51]|uniref:redoxin domain-containing protein n=1 Tax=Bacteroides sp. 51 TaxID=2302938 RepID=UPI0013D3DBB9|nr:redoxin domain-containing protein [Bacteroides sp. 51]NDV81253.1 peroxiredoxin [Bacteroides sp. 51]
MESIINSHIPPFSLQAYHDGIFKIITEKDVLGKWSILFFYPADFSPVCFNELMGLVEIQDELYQMGGEIYAISTDSQFVHKAWHNESADIQKIQFPMLGDRAGSLCNALGVMAEEESAINPSTFIVNPEGLIKIAEFYNKNVIRLPNELMRKLKAAIFIAAHPGEACPAKWNEGDETIRPSIDLIGKI